MNNTDMETFWAVLEHGTLTAAAEALFITQPTLTNRIQALEAEVGAQLFHRGKGIRHIELTEAGQRFLPLAYRWQTLLEETKGVAETPHGNTSASARCSPPTSTSFRRPIAASSTGSCRWRCGCRPCRAPAMTVRSRWPAASWRWP